MSEPGKFLIATWDGGGNGPPAYNLGARLVQRGHEVRLVGWDSMATKAAAAGVEFAAYPSVAPWPADLSPDDGWEDRVKPALLGRGRGMTSSPRHKTSPPDAIVVDCMLGAGFEAARLLGLPTAALVHVMYSPFRYEWGRHVLDIDMAVLDGWQTMPRGGRRVVSPALSPTSVAEMQRLTGLKASSDALLRGDCTWPADRGACNRDLGPSRRPAQIRSPKRHCSVRRCRRYHQTAWQSATGISSAESRRCPPWSISLNRPLSCRRPRWSSARLGSVRRRFRLRSPRQLVDEVTLLAGTLIAREGDRCSEFVVVMRGRLQATAPGARPRTLVGGESFVGRRCGSESRTAPRWWSKRTLDAGHEPRTVPRCQGRCKTDELASGNSVRDFAWYSFRVVLGHV